MSDGRRIPSPSLHSDPATDGAAQWPVVSLIWVVAGLFFPLISPATAALAPSFQNFLISTAGLSNELLANRVAFTLVRVPVTAVLGILVAVAQYAVVPDIRPLARRWLTASTIGAAVSTLILLPSSLVLTETAGNLAVETIRLFLASAGALLFGGCVSLLQRRTARGRLWMPAWSVVAAALGVTAGSVAALLLTFQ